MSQQCFVIHLDQITAIAPTRSIRIAPLDSSVFNAACVRQPMNGIQLPAHLWFSVDYRTFTQQITGQCRDNDAFFFDKRRRIIYFQ